MKHFYTIQKLFLLVVLTLMYLPAESQESYSWNRFNTGGGGYFTGMSFSQSTTGLMYATSDVCAPHRLSPGSDVWYFTGESIWPEKATGKVGTTYGMGGSTGSAVHPTNDQVVFTAMGAATDNYDGTEGLYKSTNRGATWTQVLSVFAFGNNKSEYDQQRKMGNPIEIDRQNPSVVYLGTQKNGLYRSTSNGDNGTFSKIASIPNGVQVGTKCVVVDRFSALVSGRSSIVYASVYNDGIYKSTNGGDTFTKLTGSPKCANWMVQGPNGNIYVTNQSNGTLGSSGGIWKYNGSTWTSISPAGMTSSTFMGLDVNPLNGNQIVAVANGMSIYKSADGGTNWTEVPETSMTQTGDLQYTWQGGNVRKIIQAASAVYFDPKVNGTMYVLDAFMVWKSTNVFGTGTISWAPLYKGLNNSIPFILMAPPQAASNSVAVLYAGGADASHYRYDTPGGKPASFIGNVGGYKQYMNGMDYCETKPDYIWTTSKSGWSGSTTVGWVQGGQISSVTTWNVSTPYGTDQAYATKIAVSATDEKTAVIVAGNSKPHKVTKNAGSTWTDCVGLPTGVMPVASVYDNTNPLVADKKNGNKFYCYHTRNSGEFYRSDDKGSNWTLVNSADIPGFAGGAGGPYGVRVAACPSAEGNVWVALGENGLYKTTNSGTNFSKVSYFSVVGLVDFGAPKTGTTTSTVYVHGKNTSGQWGVFSSTDLGTNWTLITPTDKPFGQPTVIAGCRKVYGRVFISDEATGISYSTLTVGSDTQAPTVPTGLTSSAIAQTSFTLSWNASSDNVGVTAYEVFKGGVSVGTTATTSLNIIGLTASTTYAMTVKAKDAAGNTSAASTALNVTTSAASDTQAPTVPAGLASSSVASTSFTLSWTASTDNVGVTAYEVFKGGISVGTTATTSMTVTGLTASTTYAMTVKAKDAAGNTSAASTALNVTTASAGTANAQIVNTTAAITIDGTQDAAYIGAAYSINNVTVGTVSSTTDLSGTWKALWDNTNLYFFVDVTDDVKINDSGTTWNDDDAVEILIDADNSKSSTYGANDFQFVFRYNDATIREMKHNAITGVVKSAVDITGGYRLEVKIPWTTLSVTPAQDNLIGLDVHVNDDDDGGTRDGKKTWFATNDNAWQNPSLLATATLYTGDTQAPTVPTGLQASAVGQTSFTLGWTASTDNVGVTAYEVFKGGVSVGTTATTSMTVTGLTASTTYAMTVKAKDAVGNTSSASTALNVTTLSVGTTNAQIDNTTATITIDGTQDAAYTGTAYPMSNVTVGTVSSSADLSGNWKALWDNTNLYFIIEVTDDAKINDSGTTWNDDDAVEILIDADNSKSTTYGANDFQFVFRYNDATIREMKHSAITGVVKSAVDITGGYRLEVKIPWTTLSVTPAQDNLIGLDVHVNDDDDGGTRDGKKTWFATNDNAWQNPSLLATVQLSSVSYDAQIVNTTAAITIDGTQDAAYSGTAYPMSNVTVGTVSSTADLSGNWKALWDNTNLYFIIEVTDDAKINDSGNTWNDDDAVEILIDADNSKSTTYGANDFQFVFRYNDATIREMKHNAITGVVKSSVDITGAYRLEVKIPWSTLLVTPAQSNLIGLDVQVNDDDDGGTRDGKKTWFATNDNAWQNPSLLATAQLSSTTLKSGSTITSVEEAFDREINVYPNPATDFLVVKLNNRDFNGIEISLFNMLTKKVKYLKAENGNEATINVNDLPQGVYILKIESGTLSSTRKVIIKH